MMEQKNEFTNLTKNILIFGLGTFGTKVLQFIVVPLYTYYLTTTEYGKIDLFMTTISLAIPFVTFLIQEAVIRFLTSGEITNKEAVSMSFFAFVISIFISLIASVIFSIVFSDEYSLFFLAILVLNAYIAIFQNYLKAAGKSMQFAISGIINSLTFIVGVVIMLAILKMNIYGYFCSMILSQLVSSIYVTVKGRVFLDLSLKKNNLRRFKQLLIYSIPLIPNNLMWWIMNVGDKYIINYYLGDSENGIYSVSIKIATVITSVFGIFMQAWQLSAIEENENKNLARFFSKMNSIMMALLLISSMLLTCITRPVFKLLINENFYSANLYSPLLCVATIINCIATFWGTTYIIDKSTKKAFVTTFIGASTNIIANLVLIKPLGLIGVALGTVCGYIIVAIIRMIDTKNNIDVYFDLKRSIIGLLLVFISSIIYIFVDDIFVLVIGVICLFIIALMYKNEMLILMNAIKKRLTRKSIK